MELIIFIMITFTSYAANFFHKASKVCFPSPLYSNVQCTELLIESFTNGQERDNKFARERGCIRGGHGQGNGIFCAVATYTLKRIAPSLVLSLAHSTVALR